MSSKENCQKQVHTVFDCLSPRKGTILAAVLANIMADGLDENQIAVLAAFATSVGDALGYIAAQMVLNDQILNNQNDETIVIP